MDYIEVCIHGIMGEAAGILAAELSERGFESFMEEEECIKAYIPSDVFREVQAEDFLAEVSVSLKFGYELVNIPEENWNAIWESDYKTVRIGGRCMIRAPFHAPVPGVEFDLVIEPKMSFGTAHHETTRLMIETLLETDLQGRKVLDMGCGTGILAILAGKMGALQVTAVDNDEWAFRNANENIYRNNSGSIHVIHGDVSSLPDRKYDVILANINRNILLRDMQNYADHLSRHGLIVMSGFYSADSGMIFEKASQFGLKNTGFRELNDWVAATFRRC